MRDKFHLFISNLLSLVQHKIDLLCMSRKEINHFFCNIKDKRWLTTFVMAYTEFQRFTSSLVYLCLNEKMRVSSGG